jgi:hypothetical protein
MIACKKRRKIKLGKLILDFLLLPGCSLISPQVTISATGLALLFTPGKDL